MSKQYVNFGAGWFKEKQDGEEYLSCSVGNKKSPVKLHLELEDGTTVPVTSFAAFINKNKQQANHPDFHFTMTLEG